MNASPTASVDHVVDESDPLAKSHRLDLQRQAGLLAFDQDELRLRYWNSTAEKLLGFALHAKQTVDDLFAATTASQIAQYVHCDEEGAQLTYLELLTADQPQCVAGTLRSDRRLFVIEFDADSPIDLVRGAQDQTAWMNHLRVASLRMEKCDSLDALQQTIAQSGCELGGFDRAWVVRSGSQGEGAIVAEVAPGRLEPREELVLSPHELQWCRHSRGLRVVVDTGEAPVSMVSATEGEEALLLDVGSCAYAALPDDQTDSLRRSGVVGAMALEISQQGSHWGWLIGHSAEPLSVSLHHQGAFALLGQAAGMHLAAWESQASQQADYAEELRRVGSDLDSFVLAASHDLREPLRGINHVVYLLQRELSSAVGEGVQSRIDALVRLTGRMQELIDGLLRLSRAGRGDLDYSEFPMAEVVAEAAEMVLGKPARSDVDLVVATLPNVTADFLCVRELLTNLLSNAVKFCDKETKRIEIGVLEAPEEVAHGRTTYYVRDNGIGIAPQHLVEVFQIFRRLHLPTDYGGGSGAGLTIAKKIAERHGGEVWIESTPGLGTTVYFTLGGSAT